MQITPGNSHAPCTQPLPRDLTLARDLTPWPLTCGPCAAQLNLWSWVNWTALHNFAKSATFLERQRSVVSACDVSCDFFRSHRASPLINLVCLLNWPFYTGLKDSLDNLLEIILQVHKHRRVGGARSNKQSNDRCNSGSRSTWRGGSRDAMVTILVRGSASKLVFAVKRRILARIAMSGGSSHQAGWVGSSKRSF